MIDNGLSAFLFAIAVTVLLLRSLFFSKNQSSTYWRLVFLIFLNLLWLLSILEIANSIWDVMYERGDYSIFFVSPTVNGFVIGIVLHFFFYKNKKYSGKM